jgi:hypothetical protein
MSQGGLPQEPDDWAAGWSSLFADGGFRFDGKGKPDAEWQG